jgi:hypothetical protein
MFHVGSGAGSGLRQQHKALLFRTGCCTDQAAAPLPAYFGVQKQVILEGAYRIIFVCRKAADVAGSLNFAAVTAHGHTDWIAC